MVKNSHANAGDTRDAGSNPWAGKIPWRRERQPTAVFLPGESHGLGTGHEESDTIEATQHTHTHMIV